MNCSVEAVYRNLRYRLINVDGKTYLADVDTSPILYFLPFIYWLLPKKVYLVRDQEIINAIKIPEKKKIKGKVKVAPFLAAGISVFLGNILSLMADYFELSTTWIINSVILFLLFSTMIFLRCYISKMFKDNLLNNVNLAELPTQVIRIRPKSIAHILKFMGAYCFISLFICGIGYASFDSLNALNILFLIIFLCSFLFANIYTVMLADYKVTFKR